MISSKASLHQKVDYQLSLSTVTVYWLFHSCLHFECRGLYRRTHTHTHTTKLKTHCCKFRCESVTKPHPTSRDFRGSGTSDPVVRPFSLLHVTRDVWYVTSSQFLQGQCRWQKTRAWVSNGSLAPSDESVSQHQKAFLLTTLPVSQWRTICTATPSTECILKHNVWFLRILNRFTMDQNWYTIGEDIYNR